MEFEYRNSEDELKYYASELNKYINQHVAKDLSCINIDCFMHSRKKNVIRAIEYKHKYEAPMKPSQWSALKELSACTHKWLRFEVFSVMGDGPDDVEIYDFQTGITYVLQDEIMFKKWLEFKVKLEDIY